MTPIQSIIRLLPVAFTVLGLINAQRIPHEFRSKCTVAENEGCFTDVVKACPSGYHLNNEYTDCSPRRHCCPCPQGSFQPQRNLCNSCIECRNCSRTSQEVSVRCNTTHDTECGDMLTTTISEASTSEEPPEEEEKLVPDTSHPTPAEDLTTETPEPVGKTGVSCPPAPTAVALIFSHLACALVVVFLCNLRIIYQKIKPFLCQTRSQSSNSLEEGASKAKKKKGKKPATRGRGQHKRISSQVN